MPFQRFRSSRVLSHCLAVLGILTLIPAVATAESQTQTQQQTKDKASSGANLAQISGMLSVGIGTYMIKEGSSSSPSNTLMIAMGAQMVVSGLQGLQGAQALSDTANRADFNANTLVSDPPVLPPTIDPRTGTTSDLKMDPALLRDGKLGEVMNKIEGMGVSRDDFAAAAIAGKMIPIPKTSSFSGIPSSKWDSLLSHGAAKNSADPNSLKEALEKSGVNSAIASYSKNGKDGSLAAMPAGTGLPGPGGASKGASSTDDFLANFGKSESEAGSLTLNGAGQGTMSPEVQAALDKNGLNEKSIFEMVRLQYRKQSPTMFGFDRKPSSESDPFHLQAENPPLGI